MKDKYDLSDGDGVMTKKVIPLDEDYIPEKDAKDDPLEPEFTKGEKDEVLPPAVGFLELYRFASGVDKLWIAIGLLSAVGTGLCSPANTLLFGQLTDVMVDVGIDMNNMTLEEIANMPMDGFMDGITNFARDNSIIGAVMLSLSYLSVMLFNTAAQSQIFRIRAAFLRSALNQDIGWYDVNQAGEFASRMTEDLSKLEDGLGEKVVMFSHYIVAFAGSLILAFIKGWKLALVCLSSLPVTFISIGIVSVMTGRLAKQEMTAYARAGTIAEEVLSSMRTVVAFGGQKKETVRFEENLVDAKNINIKRGLYSGLGFGLLWFFIYASYALAFWYGVTLIIEERDFIDEVRTYTPGVMITVFFGVMMGSMNLGMAAPFIETFGIAKGAGAKVFNIIDNKPVIDPIASKGNRPEKIVGSITFKNVHFQYPSRPDVKILQGLDLTINPGETVALVGSSGCGKSTCIQLIQRFYDPAEGTVYLDDHDMKELNVNWLRERLGVVGQEPVLFGTTITQNIKYGLENVSQEEIEKAAKEANAHDFIKLLPQGYNTLVGERGAQLSGGQKQRIAIARALIRSPKILLLDEATSALDTASEAKVQAALDKVSKGRTTIIVAHRLSTIRGADKIVVLSDGVVVEQGTHSELIAIPNGHYHGLVTAQIGDVDHVHDNQLGRSYSRLSSSGSGHDRKISEASEIVEYVAIDDDDDDKKNKAPPVSMYRILKMNMTEWPQILLGSVCSIVMGCAMPLFAVLFGEIIGVLSDPDPNNIRQQTDMYSIYFLAAGVATGVATFIQIYTFGIAGENLTMRLRGQAFSAMLRQEMGWFDDKNNGTGTLCARLSGEAAAVQGATGQRIGTILQSLATLFLGIGLSMYYEWRLGLLALAFTPFILVTTFLQRRVMEEENMGQSKALEKSTKLAVEVVSNIRTVVSLGREKMFLEQYMELLAPSVKVAKRNTHFRGFVFGLARSLMFFAFAACMYYGGYLVSIQIMSYPDVFKVSQALIMGTVSIANALAFAPNFQKGLTAAAKIVHLLERKPQIMDPVQTRTEQWTADGNVTYSKIGFFYPSRQNIQVLKGLDLTVLQGQTVALVGPSGCGKSTCIQLLERFYDPTEGNIQLDDKNIASVTLEQLRAQLGIVSQEPSLFDRSIAENIAYGDNSREVTKAEVIEAAKQANIHNFISKLPLGYDTRLGDKGTQLSGGQKQRVAIARALVRNPRVLLLDEATSALDTESEKVVQEALDKAKLGRTCITIAHRLTTIQDADVICVINNGQVAELGKHSELLSQKGLYYKLYSLQSGRR